MFAEIALLTTSFTLLSMYRMYGFKVILHPASFYLLTWILSTISFILFTNLIGNHIVYDTANLKELFIFVIYTSIVVLFVNILSFRKARDAKINLKLNLSIKKPLGFLFYLILGVTIVKFFSYGSLNPAVIRDLYLERQDALVTGKESVSIFEFLGNLIYAFNKPALLFTGIIFGSRIHLTKYRLPKIVWVPFAAGIVATLAMGGRHGIVTAFLSFALGAFIGIFSRQKHQSKIAFKKFLKYVIIAVILFSLYSTIINEYRSDYRGDSDQLAFSEYPILKPFSGLITYLVAHYPGYQLRRNDSYTDDIEPGLRTLEGLRKFEVPFISQAIGYSLSYENITGIRRVNQLSRKEREKFLPWANTTTTVFFPIIDDYGKTGAYVVIGVFVIITQFLFLRLFNKGVTSIWSLLPLFIIANLWSKSIFGSELSGNWLTNLVLAFFFFTYLFSRLKLSK